MFLLLPIEHTLYVFVNGNISLKFWDFFDNIFNTAGNIGDILLKHHFDICFCNTSKGHIQIIVAIILIWNLWIQRNKGKHNNIKMGHNRIITKTIYKIRAHYKAAVIKPSQFHCLNHVVVKLGLNISNEIADNHNILVYWHKPQAHIIKINTNSLVAKNKFGCGGIFRHYSGNMLEAFASSLSPCTVIFADLMAIFKALTICMDRNFHNVWLEVDASLLINILSNDNKGNTDIYYQKTKYMLFKTNCFISHIFREGNKYADFLVRMGTDLPNMVNYDRNIVPYQLLGLANLDKMSLPYFQELMVLVLLVLFYDDCFSWLLVVAGYIYSIVG